jgi:hypothetical protein
MPRRYTIRPKEGFSLRSQDLLRLVAFARGHARDSIYEHDITKATKSYGLSNADLAWHALNTYGWDCNEVVERGESNGTYFTITCASGTRLRVYPRQGQHPRITNSRGTYE